MKVKVKLFKWQSDAISNLPRALRTGEVSIIKSRRQVGKSVLLINLLGLTAVSYKPGSVSAAIEPTFLQARRLFKQFVKAYDPFIENSNAQRLEVEFKNGSEVQFFSAGQGDNLRGPTVSGILAIDEAAYTPDITYETVLPWTDVHRAPIYLVSTPRFKQGFFFTEYLRAYTAAPGYALYDWADTRYNDKKYTKGSILSDLLSSERLERYRNVLSSIQFRMDYLAEFVEAQSLLFGDFKRLVTNEHGKPVVLSFDCGYGNENDYTAGVALDSNGHECWVDHTNVGNTMDQVRFIYDSILKFKDTLQCISIESNSLGTVYYDLVVKMLKDHGYKTLANKVAPIFVTHDVKIEIIQQLQVAFDREKIHLLDIEWHHTELSLYEAHLTPSGKLTFDAQTGHDDSVMALAEAWYTYSNMNTINQPGHYIVC